VTIAVSVEAETVTVRFVDTGCGVADVQGLFRPLTSGAGGSGLGLYVSRALVKSFGGELVYEPRESGCCFAVVLQQANEEAVHD
jgi:signal transduction histidine kinase